MQNGHSGALYGISDEAEECDRNGSLIPCEIDRKQPVLISCGMYQGFFKRSASFVKDNPKIFSLIRCPVSLGKSYGKASVAVSVWVAYSEDSNQAAVSVIADTVGLF